MQLKLLQAKQEERHRERSKKKRRKRKWLCESRRPSVTQCTDRRTHASRRGLWEGGVALRGCALLLSFPFFPPSRPSSPPVLRPSPPLTYRLQVFFFFILRHLFPSFSQPYNLSPPVPLALFSVLHHAIFPVNVFSSSVATLHSAGRHFHSMDITGETFLVLGGTPRLPADHLLSPASIISVLVPTSSPLCSRTAGSDRLVNSVAVAFRIEQVSLCGPERVRTGLLGYFLTSEGRLSCCCVQVNVACFKGQVRHLACLLSSRSVMIPNMRTILTLFSFTRCLHFLPLLKHRYVAAASQEHAVCAKDYLSSI
ncbi:uncharacterized protein LOC117947648 isoform X2 [Etheostoma cragini]|uniref:uncharacterized protein LOC117947648 isoform X2 n=1 Tax=Etheostoma cragini TaxID=417921 RepID=UPI00155ED37B|nr:uncharacterized protein LOC117947648 isoform X2 [Etheostoma cragini]